MPIPEWITEWIQKQDDELVDFVGEVPQDIGDIEPIYPEEFYHG